MSKAPKKCLICGSKQLTGEGLDPLSLKHTEHCQRVTCMACGAIWTEVFTVKFNRIEDLHEAKNEK